MLSESTIEADDFAQAVEQLWNSPNYRKQVRAPDATHLAVGVATARNGELFVAFVDEQIPPVVDAAALEQRVVEQIVDEFARRSHCPLRSDVELTRVARYYALYLATGSSPGATQHALEDDLAAAVSTRYTGLGIQVRSIADPDEIDPRELADKYKLVDNVGVGVVQSARQGPLSGRILVVAIFGRYTRKSGLRGCGTATR